MKLHLSPFLFDPFHSTFFFIYFLKFFAFHHLVINFFSSSSFSPSFFPLYFLVLFSLFQRFLVFHPISFLYLLVHVTALSTFFYSHVIHPQFQFLPNNYKYNFSCRVLHFAYFFYFSFLVFSCLSFDVSVINDLITHRFKLLFL